MDLNRSGYYKWLRRKETPNRYELNRKDLIGLLRKEHLKHKSYGYHRLASVIRNATGWIFSDHYAHVCAKLEGIKSQARHYQYRKSGDEHILYKNLIQSEWTASRPLEIVVSDMTVLQSKGIHYEWTYILDTFNNEIIASSISSKSGDPKTYYACLNQLTAQIKGAETPTILHTDQGSIYSSQAFARAHQKYNITRSMSRSGTPTDNPIIESLNGWIKAELKVDYQYQNSDHLPTLIQDYIHHFNYDRPAYALQYKTPIQYKTDLGFT